MTDPPGPHDLASLMAEHPDQVVFGSARSTLFIGVDTNKEPFDDPRVRQAMNYGIDRGHVADLLGGPTSESPTCQILPPTFQGYEPFCPYTLEPDSGVWTAPDLDRAQALIKAAGAVRTKVTVWETDDPDAPLATPAKRLRTMTYVVGMLNDIGLHARLKTIPDIDVYAQRIYAGELPVFLFGWVSDYPRAGDFITSQFACGSDLNVTGFCEPRLDAAMLRALRLQGIDPAGANLSLDGYRASTHRGRDLDPRDEHRLRVLVLGSHREHPGQSSIGNPAQQTVGAVNPAAHRHPNVSICALCFGKEPDSVSGLAQGRALSARWSACWLRPKPRSSRSRVRTESAAHRETMRDDEVPREPKPAGRG